MTTTIGIMLVYSVSLQSNRYPFPPENFTGDPFTFLNDKAVITAKA